MYTAIRFLLTLLCLVSSSPAVVDLRSASEYVILTKTGISTIPLSLITGDMGVSPIAATGLTGFDLTLDASMGFSTSSQLTGQAFAANYAAPIPTHLTAAIGAMESAYVDAAGRTTTNPARQNLGGGILGGVFGGATAPLTPGVYTFGVDVRIAESIYFHGTETDVFIIQTTGNVYQVAQTRVHLSNGARPTNIFWQVAGQVTVAAAAHLEGILLVKTHVVFETGSSLHGRVLAQTACVLQMATITSPV